MSAYIHNVIDALVRAGAVDVLPFNYSVQYTGANAVAAGTTVVGNISIQSDSGFVADYATITVYDSPNNIVVTSLAPITCQMTDTGSGRTLMDTPQSIQNLFGGAMNANAGSGGSAPFIFPQPLVLRPTATLQIALTNLTSLTVNTGGRTFQRVDITLSGSKIFRRNNAPIPNNLPWYY